MISLICTIQSLKSLPSWIRVFAGFILVSILLQFTVVFSVDFHLKTRINMTHDSRKVTQISRLGHIMNWLRMISGKSIGGKCVKTLKSALISLI
jgi:hypothetical protein